MIFYPLLCENGINTKYRQSVKIICEQNQRRKVRENRIIGKEEKQQKDSRKTVETAQFLVDMWIQYDKIRIISKTMNPVEVKDMADSGLIENIQGRT